MSTFATNLTIDELKAEADRLFSRKKLMNFGFAPALVLAYLVYIFFRLRSCPDLQRGRTGKTP